MFICCCWCGNCWRPLKINAVVLYFLLTSRDIYNTHWSIFWKFKLMVKFYPLIAQFSFLLFPSRENVMSPDRFFFFFPSLGFWLLSCFVHYRFMSPWPCNTSINFASILKGIAISSVFIICTSVHGWRNHVCPVKFIIEKCIFITVRR